MGTTEQALNYLHDFGAQLKNMAREAKSAAAESKGTDDYEYNLGRLMAFHTVISLMQQQAEVFGIPFANLSLEDIDAERDLL